jgi:chromosome condensin MukBEF MukE localization factor
MATKTQVEQQLRKLRAENEALKAKNRQLKTELAKKPAADSKRRFISGLARKLGSVFFIALAVALLLIGNILFWTGNTVVKNDRYEATVEPVIKDPEVQKAIASYATQQIFSNVDVNVEIANVLPPRADFLAPTLANQLQSNTQKFLQTTLAKPSFQDKWNQVQFKSHAAFINTISKNGADGVIDLNELYQQLSANLSGTKLSFLANKKLPSKVGSIEVVKGKEISVMHKVITHIDRWRILAVILFLGSAAAGIWLSFRRRRTVIRLGLFMAAGMLLTLISLRVTRELIAGKVNPSYAEAVRHVVQIIFHPLAIQTATIMAASLLVAAVAWLSGPSKKASLIKARTSDLLSGKLHQALFGGHENGLTIWLGNKKRLIQWMIVGLIAIVVLLVRLTPAALVVSVLVMLVLVLAVETLAAPLAKKPRKS